MPFASRTQVGQRNQLLDMADRFQPNTVLWAFHTIQDTSDDASHYVSQHGTSFSESQSSGARDVYIHSIQAEDLTDFLPLWSQCIEQGCDGASYISNEFLASMEPAVPIDIAVPVNLKFGNNNDQH